MESQDIELLLGRDIPAAAFSDSNIGRSMDVLHKAGPSKIITELGQRAVSRFDLNGKYISYDTTSVNVWGEYNSDDSPTDGLNITYGYSKDKRPDLKQFMIELLCVEGGIPICGKTLNGNSSDKKSNNEMLTKISSIMAANGLGKGAFTYVADSAMITKDNLEELCGNQFVSRLPANYNECNAAIEAAVDANKWVNIGVLSEATHSDDKKPAANYKCQEGEVVLHEKAYRAIIIHSSALDKRRLGKLERNVKSSSSQIQTSLKKQISKFECEKDAEVMSKKMESMNTKLHNIKTKIKAVTIRKRGRTAEGKEPSTQTSYQVSWSTELNKDEYARLEKIAGCFVLITNIAKAEDLDSTAPEILKIYKGQHRVERDFSFLKDPLIVNDTFLKMPSRIEVLGMVLIISLMIWRLMERSMRVYLKNNDVTIPGWDNKKTKTPTSFMMSTKVRLIIVIRTSENIRYIQKKPSTIACEYLKALGLDQSIFTDPKSVCTKIIPIKSTF